MRTGNSVAESICRTILCLSSVILVTKFENIIIVATDSKEVASMNDYVLTCCSTADMPKSYFEERTIPFVCFHFIMDGVTYPDDLGQSMPFDQFYRMLAEGSESLTSQVNVEEYKTFFEPFLKKGLDILHISTSSGISGSYHSAVIRER